MATGKKSGLKGFGKKWIGGCYIWVRSR